MLFRSAPYFKVENLLKLHNGVAVSSNNELYSDISNRVMSIIKEQYRDVEIYSIDEAFVKINDYSNYQDTALFLRNKILKDVGVSVSIGVAKSKTLCKIAGEVAKAKQRDKVCILDDDKTIDTVLDTLELGKIWGVGKNSIKKLNYLGLFTALELKNANAGFIRKNFSISLEKTLLELRQYSCIAIREEKLQHSIIYSRTFEFEIKNLTKLKQIMSGFIDVACLRLRQQQGIASGVIINLQSNRFKTDEFYDNSQLVSLDRASCNPAKFIKAMEFGVSQIYKPNIWYKKAGITLTSIETNCSAQNNFFENKLVNGNEKKLMAAYDIINEKLGKQTIFLASQMSDIKSYVKRKSQSPKFSTSWEDLLIVK